MLHKVNVINRDRVQTWVSVQSRGSVHNIGSDQTKGNMYNRFVMYNTLCKVDHLL